MIDIILYRFRVGAYHANATARHFKRSSGVKTGNSIFNQNILDYWESYPLNIFTYPFGYHQNSVTNTVNPRYTVPRYTVFLDIPCTVFFPQIPCLAVFTCKTSPHIPCTPIYRALFLSPEKHGIWGFDCIIIIIRSHSF